MTASILNVVLALGAQCGCPVSRSSAKHSQQFTAHWHLILMNWNCSFLLVADLSVQFGLFTGTRMHTSHFKWGLRWCELHTSVVTDPQQVLRKPSSWNHVTFTLNGDLIWILLKIQHFYLSCLVLGRPGLFLSLKAIFINSILSCNEIKYCEKYKRKVFFSQLQFCPQRISTATNNVTYSWLHQRKLVFDIKVVGKILPSLSITHFPGNLIYLLLAK